MVTDLDFELLDYSFDDGFVKIMRTMVSTLPFLLVNKRGSAAAVTTDTVRDENHVFLSIFLFLVKIAVALVPVPYVSELDYQ